MNKKIWLSPPHMSGNEMKYIQEAFDQNWIAPVGPNITAFEEELCKSTKSPHAVAVSSGTAALHLALLALGTKKGDIVLCQSLTFAATANPVRYVSATPVFIDSEPDTWNICPNALEDAILFYLARGKKPVAIICTHLYGMPAKLTEILELSKKYEVALIEDAAEAVGSAYHGQKLGTFGELGVLSCNGNKIITCSTGGAVLTKRQDLAEKIRFLAAQAKDKAPHYQHSQIGYNYLMSNICAGIGRAQLGVLQDRVDKRRAVFLAYLDQLGALPGLLFQPESGNAYSNRWLTAIRICPKLSGVSCMDIYSYLNNFEIETRPVWKPMHLQPVFAKARFFGGDISEKIFSEGLCLPSGSNLEENDIHLISSKISDYMERKKAVRLFSDSL